MSTRMTATEARAHLLALIDRVAAGEEVEITRHGCAVARLVPASSPRGLGGLFEGQAMTAADEDDLFTTRVAWAVQT